MDIPECRRRGQGPDVGMNMFNAATALETLMQISKDPLVLEASLRAALQAHSGNTELQNLLLARYARIDEHTAKAIHAELGLPEASMGPIAAGPH